MIFLYILYYITYESNIIQSAAKRRARHRAPLQDDPQIRVQDEPTWLKHRSKRASKFLQTSIENRSNIEPEWRQVDL